MKKQLLLLAALSLTVIGASAQGVWTPQATGFPIMSTGVFNVSVVDSATVWISSYDGSGAAADIRDYSVTIDGGDTWIPGVVPAPATHAWSMIFGLDASTAWAVMYNAVAGSGGGIWKTADGGVTWNQQGVGTIYNATSFPNVVHFWNANEGFSMGDPNPSAFELYTTTDGGTTWVPVPSANIPAPLAGEYGIVNHYEVIGNTIWFDTNKGRVYKSTDKGLNWTVSSTGLTVPANGAIDIVFYDALNGFARLYAAITGTNTVRRTSDGGATWSAGTVTGNMFGSDLAYVPGTASRIVSTGADATNGFTGSSFSNDGGLTWTDIETGTQRTALGVWDINTMWAGGFTTSPSSDGIFKFEPLSIVACGDPSINSGVISALDSTICFGDTLFVSTIGAAAPTVGTVFGWSMIVSSGDISFNTDPLSQPGILGGTGVLFPVPATINTTLINSGAPFVPGTYYFTPVVYGNATGTGTNITSYVLDPSCTYTGQSVMFVLYPDGDPACLVGINEPTSSVLSLNAYQFNDNQMSVNLISAKQSNVELNVYDLTGRVVISKELSVTQGPNSFVLDIATLGTGAYVIRVNDNNSFVTSKLVRY
ncbi:MAG: T9SS type A sorting domain-containing protein [Bacteroidota bacterium]|nr:T9SS type A sorting domain-containing protein [Bacteroidota bacterium]